VIHWGERPRQEAGGDDVRVRSGVLLEEVVLAAVAGELELGADADGGAGGLGAGDGLLDVAEVGVKVHRPLVEVARGDPQQPHLAPPQRSDSRRLVFYSTRAIGLEGRG